MRADEKRGAKLHLWSPFRNVCTFTFRTRTAIRCWNARPLVGTTDTQASPFPLLPVISVAGPREFHTLVALRFDSTVFCNIPSSFSCLHRSHYSYLGPWPRSAIRYLVIVRRIFRHFRISDKKFSNREAMISKNYTRKRNKKIFVMKLIIVSIFFFFFSLTLFEDSELVEYQSINVRTKGGPQKHRMNLNRTGWRRILLAARKAKERDSTEEGWKRFPMNREPHCLSRKASSAIGCYRKHSLRRVAC